MKISAEEAATVERTVRSVPEGAIVGIETDADGGDDQYSNAVRAFERTGKHGTCVACPSDDEGWSLPEHCQFTDRYDHQSTYRPERSRYRA